MIKTNFRLVLAGLLVLATLFSLSGPVAAQPEGKIIRLIVTLEPGADRDGVARDYGSSLRHSFPGSVVSLDLSEDKLSRLQQDHRVKSVRPAVIVEAIQDTLDWGVDRIDAEKVWGGVEDVTDVAAGRNAGEGIKVAIVDTGMDYNHPDLAANYKGGYDYVNNDANPMDDNGHGTHVAGIIAASDNGAGVIGVAPKAWLYAVKVLSSTGSGYEDDVADGIWWCFDENKDGIKDRDISVISMSLGANSDMPLVRQACDAAYNAGLLLVAAAGNSGFLWSTVDTVSYPARYDSVIAVGATDNIDKRARFTPSPYLYWSSTGPSVELAAPGKNIYSTYRNSGYATLSGTSMACPMVTGTAALVWKAYPGYTNEQVRQRLQSTAQDLGVAERDWEFGFGLVNAEAAAASGDSPPTVSITTPLNSSFVSGTVSVTASASDDMGVTQVDFYVDAGLAATDTAAPYQYSWNTASASDGSHTLKAVATDTASQTAEHTVTVMVDNTSPVVSIVNPTEGATVSGTITIRAQVTEANIDNVKYQIDAGGPLPMTLNGAYWEASWNSTSVANGAHTITVIATDKVSHTGSDSHNITISNTVVTPLAITTTSLSAGQVGVAYSQTLAASGGTPPYTWSISWGSLPAGLSLNASTGVISGTPTAAGIRIFIVKVNDSAGHSATRTLFIVIR